MISAAWPIRAFARPTTGRRLRATLMRADVRGARRRQARKVFRGGADDHALGGAPSQLEADLARSKVERDPTEVLKDVGSEEQGRLVGKTEQLERRNIGERDRHVAQKHRTQPKF